MSFLLLVESRQIPIRYTSSFFMLLSLPDAGMKRIRFHDLRHTHTTIMLEIGENSKVESERLGHSKVSITLDKVMLLRIYRTPLQKTFQKLQE